MEKKTRKSDLLVEFVSDFKRNEKEYKSVCAAVKRKLKALLDSEGIIAIVSARVKDPDRLLLKLRERDAEKHYTDAVQIARDIPDLVGARIALYFPSDAEKLQSLLEKEFRPKAEGEGCKRFPEQVTLGAGEAKKFTAAKRKIYPGYNDRRFDGYCAVHYRVEMRYPPALTIPNPIIEIQVASVLMHAWSEVEHDLAYKNMMGRVSMEEYEALDEINGLVIAGEVALNRLDRLSKERLRKSGATLDTVFALSTYLENWLEDEKTGWMAKQKEADGALTDEDLQKRVAEEKLFTRGDVKALFDRYTGGRSRTRNARHKVDSDLKKKKSTYDAALPLAEQLLALHDRDQEPKPAAPKKKKVEQPFSVADPALLGAYLVDWINLQRSLRNLLRDHGFRGSSDSDVYSFVGENFELSQLLRKSYQALHLERNKIIHGNFAPGSDYLRKQREDMADFLRLAEEELA